MERAWQKSGRRENGPDPSRPVFIWKKKTVRTSHCELGQGLLTDLFLKTWSIDLVRILSSYLSMSKFFEKSLAWFEELKCHRKTFISIGLLPKYNHFPNPGNFPSQYPSVCFLFSPIWWPASSVLLRSDLFEVNFHLLWILPLLFWTFPTLSRDPASET